MKIKIEIESRVFWEIMDMLKKEIWYNEADAESYKYLESENGQYTALLEQAEALRKTTNDLFAAYRKAEVHF